MFCHYDLLSSSPPQTKAGSGNDILRQLCSGKGREKEISGGADKEAPSERKALIDLDPEMCKYISVNFDNHHSFNQNVLQPRSPSFSYSSSKITSDGLCESYLYAIVFSYFHLISVSNI